MSEFSRAALKLAKQDPVIARLRERFGPPKIPAPAPSHFEVLVRSIVYQQLATAAANAIHGRLVAALDGTVTPEQVLATPHDPLRAAGLSERKVASLQDLSAKILDGSVPLDDPALATLGDAEISASLSSVKGIGKWSADIFLMFQLHRLDIWPTGDLAVRRGFARAWEVPVPKPKELDALGEPYHPYRSVVAWYCWQADRAADRAGDRASD